MAIEVTDFVYQGNGAIITFSDNSVAAAQFQVVDGQLDIIGLNDEQKVALQAFNAGNISPFAKLLDERLRGDITSDEVDTKISNQTGPTITNSIQYFGPNSRILSARDAGIVDSAAVVTQLKLSNYWFTVSGPLIRKMETQFAGVVAESASIITDGTVFAWNDLGDVSALDEAGGGMRVTTGGTTDDEVLIQNGDSKGSTRPWGITGPTGVTMHIIYRSVVAPSDALICGGMWDGTPDNRVCLHFDDREHPYTRLQVYREGVAAADLPLAPPIPGLWIRAMFNITGEAVVFASELLENAIVLPAAPIGPLSILLRIITLEDAAKTVDVRHLYTIEYGEY